MNDRTNLLQIDADRLWDTMMASARIGPGRDQGLRRLALDASDKEMRDLFVAWCRDAGAAVSVDKMGNVFARRAGRDDDAAPVLVGSHLDTQYTGGKFDGILGVLAGLEIIRTLDEHGIETRRPIEVVNWSNEEGARFNPPMLASAVFAGVRDLEWAYARTDNDGVTYGSALAEIGYVGDTEMGGRDVDAYFELHIEQGPILEKEGIAVGVVTHGYATRGMRLRIAGETAHSGPTPMDQRRNALVGAAYLIAAVVPPLSSSVPARRASPTTKRRTWRRRTRCRASTCCCARCWNGRTDKFPVVLRLALRPPTPVRLPAIYIAVPSAAFTAAVGVNRQMRKLWRRVLHPWRQFAPAAAVCHCMC